MQIDWTAAGVIVALVVGAGGVIVAGLALRANTRKSVQDDGEWKGRVDTDRSNFKDFMARIDGTIQKIQEDINRIFLTIPPDPFSRYSPIRLNDLGKAISTDVGGNEWACRHADATKPSIEGFDAYEIQHFCFEYVNETEYSDEEKKVIRSSAYENGLTRDQVRRVLAIELRDKLLEVAGLEAP